MYITLTDRQDGHTHACALRTRGQRLKRCDRRWLKREFFRQYARYGTVKATCQQVGIARNTFYGWLQRDTDFADRYYGMVSARFEAEMREVDRMYSFDLDSDDYWMHRSEGELIHAMKRMNRIIYK